MSESADDAERLRIRADLIDWQDAPPPPPVTGSISRSFKTKTVTTYPTAKGVYYAMTTGVLTGAEVEGGAGTLTYSAGDTVYGFLLPSAQSIPPTGTTVMATLAGPRWIIDW